MNNLLSYCWLVDARISTSEKDLPVQKKNYKKLTIKKSISSAIPAYKAKARTAGISDKAPKKKHVASEDEESNIEGATSPTTRPRSSTKKNQKSKIS